jgi:hypothetical protein
MAWEGSCSETLAQLINPMEQRVLEKLAISDSGEILYIFRYTKLPHPIIKGPLINPILKTINPVHAPHFLYSHLLTAWNRALL